jgi:putative membrane protein
VTWYEFLLFVHISMAVIWVGGATIIQLFALRALRAPDPTRMADFASDASYISTRVFIPASLLALVSGVWMVLDSDFIGFGDDWIVIGLILYAVTFLAGALFFGPESGRIKQQIDAEGPTSPGVQARIQRILALSRADLMLLFTLIYDMSVKPEWGDAWLWIALAGFAALAGVLVRNGLKTRVAGGAAVPAG